ncbi:MAG: hypothetical protein F6K58_23705 [Symploca sp. SIO2E9]|nr:hypothetical protein [Symploca sp. SIO2E9]
MDSKVHKNTFNCRQLSVNLSNKSAGIKQLLQQQLLIAINSSGMDISLADLSSNAQLRQQLIPLYRLSNQIGVIYRCASALKLAAKLQLRAVELANQLMISFPNNNYNSASVKCLELSVEVESSGWINFKLSDWALAIWLQDLMERPSLEEYGSKGILVKGKEGSSIGANPCIPQYLDNWDPNTSFQLQYLHARCCSLLRLAHQQGLITLKKFDFKTPQLQIIEPNPIPWLQENQVSGTEALRLRLTDSTEQNLIGLILDCLDEIGEQNQFALVKRGSTLSLAFEEFYSECRIWGEVKTHNLGLAQARLGLLAVTQSLVRSLLQDQLGIDAPLEL